MLHRVEGANVTVDVLGAAAGKLALVVGLERNHIQAVAPRHQRPGVLGADGEPAGDLVFPRVHDGDLIRRGERHVCLAGAGEGDAHGFVEAGGERLRVDVLDGGDHFVEGAAGGVRIDHAHRVRDVIRHPHLAAVRPHRHAHRINAHVDALDHPARGGVDHVHGVRRRVRHVDVAAARGDGPGMWAHQHRMADAGGREGWRLAGLAGVHFGFQQGEEPFQIGVVVRVRLKPLATAVPAQPQHLVQHQPLAGGGAAEQPAERLDVPRQMVFNARWHEHQARVAGAPAGDMAVHALALHDGCGHACREHVRRGCDGFLGSGGGQIRQVAGGAFEQAHRADGRAGFDLQLPFAGPGAERAGEVLMACLQRRGKERTCAPRRNGESNLFAFFAGVVDAVHRHGFLRLAGVHHAQNTPLVQVSGRVEERNPLPPLSDWNHVVHAGEEAVFRADVHVHGDVLLRGELQAPIALAVANAGGKALGGVAVFQVDGVEVDGAAALQLESDFRPRVAGIVERVDTHGHVILGAIDHAQEALPAARVVLGGKQRHMVRLGFAGHVRFARHAGEIRQPAGFLRKQQAHDVEGSLGRNRQAPLAGAGAQRALQIRVAFLQVLRRVGSGGVAQKRQPDVAVAGFPVVVNAPNDHIRGFGARIDQPQLTHLVFVAGGVEHDHPVVAVRHRREVAHAREKTVFAGAKIRQRFNVQHGRKRQPPIPLRRRPNPLGQALVRVALLEIPRVEVNGSPGVQPQRHRPGALPGVVNPFDAHHAVAAAVDHAHEPFAHVILVRAAVGREQPDEMALLREAACRYRTADGDDEIPRTTPRSAVSAGPSSYLAAACCGRRCGRTCHDTPLASPTDAPQRASQWQQM